MLPAAVVPRPTCTAGGDACSTVVAGGGESAAVEVVEQGAVVGARAVSGAEAVAVAVAVEAAAAGGEESHCLITTTDSNSNVGASDQSDRVNTSRPPPDGASAPASTPHLAAHVQPCAGVVQHSDSAASRLQRQLSRVLGRWAAALVQLGRLEDADAVLAEALRQELAS